ncbi:dihydrodipicolinate synthase family protein [Candidatus Bathyarchaeota archaeon]|nr:dihydrodipicolinate synthase family protein [Candidatus Bathyarchaeota archaeon]
MVVLESGLFKGLIPATVLPMDESFKMDEDELRRYIDWISHFKVSGLAVNVDTGEGPHLYFEEQLKVIEIYREELKGRIPIVTGLSARFTDEAVKNAKMLKEAGADALLVFPIPAYAGDPLDPEIPYSYHKAISEAVSMPLIVFQLQRALGGVEYSEQALKKLFEVEDIVAIKEASFDARKFTETLRVVSSLKRKVYMLTGNDNFILESFILGADGGLLGFGTIATDLQVEMIDRVKRRDYDEAFEISRRINPLADAIFMSPVRNYRARLKEALVMLGVLKKAYVRPPLTPISEAERKAVRNALRESSLL